MRLPQPFRVLSSSLLATMLCGPFAAAQAGMDVTRFAGEWHGTLQIGGPALRLSLVMQPAAVGQLIGVLYSERITAADLMPWLHADSAVNMRATEELRSTILTDPAREQARFTRELPGAKAVTLRANHYQFLSNPDETERQMRTFLAALLTPRGG